MWMLNSVKVMIKIPHPYFFICLCFYCCDYQKRTNRKEIVFYLNCPLYSGSSTPNSRKTEKNPHCGGLTRPLAAGCS
jgi:hypothetical protein